MRKALPLVILVSSLGLACAALAAPSGSPASYVRAVIKATNAQPRVVMSLHSDAGTTVEKFDFPGQYTAYYYNGQLVSLQWRQVAYYTRPGERCFMKAHGIALEQNLAQQALPVGATNVVYSVSGRSIHWTLTGPAGSPSGSVAVDAQGRIVRMQMRAGSASTDGTFAYPKAIGRVAAPTDICS